MKNKTRLSSGEIYRKYGIVLIMIFLLRQLGIHRIVDPRTLDRKRTRLNPSHCD